MTARSVRLSVRLALVAFTAMGCATINEAITGRDLDCQNVPDDVCVRAADFAWSRIGLEAEAQLTDPVTNVTVMPSDCSKVTDPQGFRCWEVIFNTDEGAGMGTVIQELPDGAFAWN